jgi:formate-dependent nitrite reductase membrane component NrfD
MNVFVEDPEWGWWIILYFYFGGIAAGAYFLATLIELFGGALSRDLPRVGYWLAFPLILLCGLFLTVDLEHPERFWHMLFRSEKVHEAFAEGWPAGGWGAMLHAPLLKTWSPMSVGSWALSVFGLCSGLSFLGSLWPEGRLERLFRRSILGRLLQIVGSLVGFFVASYTGTLLSATNQPLWSDTAWLAPLFLSSAASTGAAATVLVAHWTGVGSGDAEGRLERVDAQALILELLVFVAFLASLGEGLIPVWATPRGKLLVLAAPIVAMVLPLGFYLVSHYAGGIARGSTIAAVLLTLGGGLLLRYALLTTPPEILARGPAIDAGLPQRPVGTPSSEVPLPRAVSPEDGRAEGQLGADPNNRSPQTHPRSRVFENP